MGLKVIRVVVLDDAGEEITLNVLDSTMLAICEGDAPEQTKVLSQVTTNSNINLELMKRIIAPAPVAAPQETEAAE